MGQNSARLLSPSPSAETIDRIEPPSTSSSSSSSAITRAPPTLEAHGKRRKAANSQFFGLNVRALTTPEDGDEFPRYLESTPDGPALRPAFVLTTFGEDAHLVSDWKTFEGWTYSGGQRNLDTMVPVY